MGRCGFRYGKTAAPHLGPGVNEVPVGQCRTITVVMVVGRHVQHVFHQRQERAQVAWVGVAVVSDEKRPVCFRRPMFEQQRVQGMVVLHNVIGIADVSMTGRGGLLRDSMGRRWCCAVDHITGGGVAPYQGPFECTTKCRLGEESVP